MSRSRLICSLLGLTFGVIVANAQQAGYSTAQEAFTAGATFLRQNNLVKAQEALEAALKLDPDETLKGKIYRGLVRPYSRTAYTESMLEALEHIIAHPSSPAEQTLTRSQLLAYVQQRNKAKEAAQRYEDALKKDPKDANALFILSAVYADLLRDARRGAELTERLAAVKKDAGGKVDLRTALQLAQQYVRSGKFKEAAELYEQCAQIDDRTKAWDLKEAAVAWIKAGDKDRARAAALLAVGGAPEERSKQLSYFWHRGLGDVLIQTGDYRLAVVQLERALQKAEIDGYKRDTEQKLAEARQKAGN